VYPLPPFFTTTPVTMFVPAGYTIDAVKVTWPPPGANVVASAVTVAVCAVARPDKNKEANARRRIFFMGWVDLRVFRSCGSSYTNAAWRRDGVMTQGRGARSDPARARVENLTKE
jgi:hypothetical protein